MRAIRVCVIACVAIAGCKGTENKVDNATTGSSSSPASLDLPRVDEDRAVVDAAKIPKPVAVVWIDAKGNLEVAHVDGAWTGVFPTGTRSPAASIAAARAAGGGAHGRGNDDDPPPPPPEDDADGRDDSGGTGTATALDKGKMGKKDADRAEGQYKMKHENDDPQLARQQAIEEARKAGFLGAKELVGAIASFAALDSDSVLPSVPVADLRADRAIVVAAAPGAPAIQLVRIVVDESGAIAVSNHGKLAVLSRGYGMPAGASEGRPPGWVELHVKGDGVHVIETSKRDQTVVAWKQGTVDRDGLRTTYEKLKAEAVAGDAPYIEVLVGEGPTAQQLVDVLVTLDGLGATLVSLGELVGTTEARLAHFAEVAKPVVEFGQPVANGDLDKAIIRRTVKENVAKITACYETQLAAKPGLRGVVTVQFFIAPPGAVTSSTASGVDPELATCVATVIKGITFAKPKGGGGVQVNYPFVFRPHHLLL